MKKNTMMRVASALLVAVLLSTSVISGTFAKYTTAVEGSDSARVAHWGINKDFTGAVAFEDVYSTDVKSNGDLVVAPGTTGSGTYALTGTPEVDYNVTFAFTATKDVFLKAQAYTYGDGYADSMDIASMTEDYHPLTWKVTLTTTNGAVSGTGALTVGENSYTTLAAAAAAINATTVTFDATEECDLSLTITWTWAISQNDQADTILGNLVAGGPAPVTPATLTVDADYSVTVAYSIVMTATQINA